MKSTVVNGDHRAEQAAAAVDLQGLDRQALLDVYRCMVRSRKLDD